MFSGVFFYQSDTIMREDSGVYKISLSVAGYIFLRSKDGFYHIDGIIHL